MRETIERILQWGGRRPLDIARTTILLYIFVYYMILIVKFLYKNGFRGSRKIALRTAYRLAVNTLAKKSVEKKMQAVREDLEEKLTMDCVKGEAITKVIPRDGVPKAELIAKFKKWSKIHKTFWNGDKIVCSGTVYHGNLEMTDFLNKAYSYFSLTNPLHPDVFPFTRKMEAEIIRMTASALNGSEDSCGVLTSGGTESIICAVRTYRNWARQVKGITKPELIIPNTAHAAFDKACEMLGIEAVHVPVNMKTFQVEPANVKRYINGNTIAIISSFPNYPQGVFDKIQELAELAKSYNIGLHVDACLGSFLVVHLPKIGYTVPPFDFRVPGVTSISIDTHKYGFCTKGSSVVLFHSEKLRRHCYFIVSQWTGGLYATPTIQGSRSGGIVAATWAALMAIGENGYIDAISKIMKEVEIVKKGIKSISELKIQGTPGGSVIAFDSARKDLNIYAVAGEMEKRGWALNKLQNPPGIHICVTCVHFGKGKNFVKTLKSVVQAIIEKPDNFEGGDVALYGTMASLPEGVRGGVLDEVMSIVWDVLLDVNKFGSAGR